MQHNMAEGSGNKFTNNRDNSNSFVAFGQFNNGSGLYKDVDSQYSNFASAGNAKDVTGYQGGGDGSKSVIAGSMNEKAVQRYVQTGGAKSQLELNAGKALLTNGAQVADAGGQLIVDGQEAKSVQMIQRTGAGSLVKDTTGAGNDNFKVSTFSSKLDVSTGEGADVFRLSGYDGKSGDGRTYKPGANPDDPNKGVIDPYGNTG
jgi:hypothetical protein